MSDEEFRKLCNVFGFAPSRALRELIDCATARAEADEREQCAKVCDSYDISDDVSMCDTAEGIAAAIRARKEKQ